MTSATAIKGSPLGSTALGDSETDALLKNAIVVIGAPRSGTTFLTSLLGAHQGLCLLEEPRLTWRYGNDARSDMLAPELARPEVVRYIRRRFALDIREAGKTRLLEKTPANALRPAFVDRVLPGCRFIHILRHGLDSTLSIQNYWEKAAHGTKGLAPGRLRKRLGELELRRLPHYAREAARRLAPAPLRPLVRPNVWGPRLPGIDEMLRDMDLLEVCALQWRTCVEITREYGRTLPADRYLEIKLEELTPDKLEEVLTFAGLDDTDGAVRRAFGAKHDATASGGRKADADPNAVRRVMGWVRPTLADLGYAAPDEVPAKAATSAPAP